MKFSSPKNFFTVVELLIVISIIGIIISISFISYSNVRQKSRDTKRITDIKLIQKSLEDYYRNEGAYPISLTPGQSLVGSSSSSTYLQVIPQNPSPRNDGACLDGEYTYRSTATGTNYMIDFCLSETIGDLPVGQKCATPQGIANSSCDSYLCPSPLYITTLAGHTCNTGAPDYDQCTYNTILIGTQCWMRENLNVGSMVTGVTTQADNEILEKYCYNNNAINPNPSGNTGGCDTDGALYQWGETMQYSVTPGAQGVCPNGWHIPTDAEQYTLENYLTDPPNACDANRSFGWSCSNAGTKLNSGGTSGFDGVMTGARESDGTFIVRGEGTAIWSSSYTGYAWYGWYRQVNTGISSVFRYYDALVRGFSIRCLKN
jgi:uncharacterized protein (TIGR02145 family)